jgi:acetyl-CoA C-acetyltransferase
MKSLHDKKKGIAIVYDDIFLISGARTPFGRLAGTLGGVSPTDLGIFASKAALKKSGLEANEIDQAIIANIGQSSSDAYFLPRHISLFSGVPQTVPSLMVQRICGSGFETIVTGAEQITLGKAAAVLCTGTESMSLSPTVSFGNRMGYQLGRINFKDMLWESLNDTAAGFPMGFTAENIAKKHAITREEVDVFAKRSFDTAIAARERGFFDDEIATINSTVFEAEGLVSRKVRLPRGVMDFRTDESIRPTDLQKLAKLGPVFGKEGVQTAGNSSSIVDGAASVVIGDKSIAESLEMKTLTKVVAASTSALDPKLMGLGPVPAIRLLLEISGLKLDEIGLIEINEAFGAQFIGCERELGFDREIANVNGGAIAIGHPLGATGLRLSLTISREMNLRKVKYGIASACIGGGQGTAVLFENANI